MTPFLEALARASLEGGIAVAIVALIVRFVPRLSSSLAAGLWWLVCLKFALALAPLSSMPWAIPISTPPPIATFSDDSALLAERVPLDRSQEVEMGTSSRSVQAFDDGRSLMGEPFTPRGRTIAVSLALIVWAAGVLTVATRGIASLVRARRWIADGSPPEGADLALGKRLARTVGLAVPPVLRLSRSAPAPLLVSIGRPTVVLPEKLWITLDASQRAMVLAHELIHVRRRDALMSWLPWAVECVFWFHPLARLAAREFALAREAACDDAVLRRLDEAPRRYGELLLRVGVGPRISWAGIGVAPGIHSLRRRIVMLDRAGFRHHARHGVFALALIALVTLVPLRFTNDDGAKALTDHSGDTTTIWTEDDARTVALVDGENVSMVGCDPAESANLARIVAKQRNAERLLVILENGDTWIVDDPKVLDETQKIFRQLDDLGEKQAELGALQAELGVKQEELGVRQAELGQKMAELGLRMAELHVELQRAILQDEDTDEIQAAIEAVGKRMEELGRAQGALGEAQGELGEKQGALGERQGEIGEEQGRRSRIMQSELDALVEDVKKKGLAKEWEG